MPLDACRPALYFSCRSINFTAKANFWLSVGNVAIMILGHVMRYFQLNLDASYTQTVAPYTAARCNADVYARFTNYLFIWDACVVLFLYLRYRG